MPFDAAPLVDHDLSTGLGRLRRLRDHWLTIDPDQVSLDCWSCETQACLGGWAARLPEFQELGLRLVPIDSWETPVWGILRGAPALAEFFGLRFDVACDLFGSVGLTNIELRGVSDWTIGLWRLNRAISGMSGVAD